VKEVFDAPDNYRRWGLLDKRRRDVQIAAAFRQFREQGLEPLVIKGWAAALNYPSDMSRPYTDLDLAFSAAEYEKAVDLYKSGQIALPLAIDLHKELRHLDSLPWEDLFANSRLLEADGEPIRVLRAEDNLRVLCVHWLTDGGANRERLWDIYYAISNRDAGFDWDRCLSGISQFRREWVACVISVTNKYLGLNLDGIPLTANELQVPQWVVRCVEHEWEDHVILYPLLSVYNDPKKLLQQVRKRIPPNPIRSTIESEGSLRHGWRTYYQAKVYLRRIPAFINSSIRLLKHRFDRNA
jgi:hypothetical protein